MRHGDAAAAEGIITHTSKRGTASVPLFFHTQLKHDCTAMTTGSISYCINTVPPYAYLLLLHAGVAHIQALERLSYCFGDEV